MVSSASNRPLPPETICVVDSGVIMLIKQLVALDAQWSYLTAMSRMVEEGRITFPRQVAKELKAVRYPDAPGAWAANAHSKTRYQQPSDESLVEVLDAAQLLDADADLDREVADPYVIAQALELAARFQDSHVVVATEDYVDRMPVKESIATACKRLDLEDWRATTFIEWVAEHITDSDL